MIKINKILVVFYFKNLEKIIIETDRDIKNQDINDNKLIT